MCAQTAHVHTQVTHLTGPHCVTAPLVLAGGSVEPCTKNPGHMLPGLLINKNPTVGHDFITNLWGVRSGHLTHTICPQQQETPMPNHSVQNFHCQVCILVALQQKDPHHKVMQHGAPITKKRNQTSAPEVDKLSCFCIERKQVKEMLHLKQKRVFLIDLETKNT